jgi:hypothetical protein
MGPGPLAQRLIELIEDLDRRGALEPIARALADAGVLVRLGNHRGA